MGPLFSPLLSGGFHLHSKDGSGTKAGEEEACGLDLPVLASAAGALLLPVPSSVIAPSGHA